MSYATKYTITFNSLKRITYTVNILVDGFLGTPQRLRASTNPFTIDEDHNENYFEPIRTQSGYIRIVNESTDLDGNPFDYKGLIATNSQSHQVQLISGGSLVWIGFIRPVVLTTTLFGYRNTLEIPIQCPLAVLGTINLSFDSTTGTFLTMGQIVFSMFSKINNITWGNVYLTANVKHIDQANNLWPFPDLNSKISMFNFSENDDPTIASGSTFTNYTATWEDETPCSEILEKICRFWGWTLYTRGSDIFLVAPGVVHNYYQIAFNTLQSQLNEIAVTTADSPTDIDVLTYKSTKHTEEYMKGYRRITIKTDAKPDNVVVNPRLDDLDYAGFQVVTYGSGDNRYASVQAWLENPQQIHRLFHHNVRIYESPADYIEDPTFNYYNVLSWFDDWKIGVTNDWNDIKKMNPKNSFSLKQCIAIYSRPWITGPIDPTTRDELEAQTYLGITTLNEIAIPAKAQICLYAKVKFGLDPTNQYTTRYEDFIRMYLRVGNYYWNGTGWSNSIATFRVYMNDRGEFLTTREIYNQATVDDSALYPNAEGYIVFNDSQTRKGNFEVGFLNYPEYNTNVTPHVFSIIDFGVKCVVQDKTIQPQNKNGQTYEDVASNMFQDNLTIDLSISSGTKNLFGKGQLYASRNNDERFGGCYYEGVTQPLTLPEKNLLNNMKRVYSQTRHRMRIEVAENEIHANPLTRFIFKNKNYIMQAAQHNFSEDTMLLTLIEE